MYKEYKIRVALEFSKAILETRIKKARPFKIHRENNFKSRNLYQATLSVKCEGL